MNFVEMLHTTGAIAGLTIILIGSLQLKRYLKRFVLR